MLRTGAHRYVLVVGHFVVKVPRVRMLHFLRLVVEDDIVRYRKRFWWSWPGFATIVFAGLMENFREARCYLKTKHCLLARLYLPLIFVNIYRRENGVGNFTFGGDELTEKVYETGDSEYLEALLPCSHTFDHTENFAFSNGRVKILDYGEEGFQNLLTTYGGEVEKLLLSVVK